MGANYFNRYKSFSDNNYVKPIPNIKITEKSTDKTEVYRLGLSRLDVISQDYYGSPYYGWLIMLANPQHGGLEFSIPDSAVIRIPFPLNTTLEEYEKSVKKHLTLYGE